MKKFIIGVGLLIGATAAATAQHSEFGVKGGLNLSNFTGNDVPHKSLASVHLGILDHIHINNMWAIQPEVVYSVQGTKYTNENSDFRYANSYINIPVLAQLMTPVGVRFETGPQVGFLVSAKNKSGNTTVDVKDQFKSTDVSWAFGVGYITPSKFGFDARYNLGLTDVTKDASNVKNSVFQLGVFYQFHK